MTDIELVKAARGGDQAAFDEFYRRHVESVRAVCRGNLRTNDVDDVCQEIFQKAFHAIGGFQGNAQFKTWLTAIANRECSRIKAGRRRPTKGSDHIDPYVDVDEHGKVQELRYQPEWKRQFIDVEEGVDFPKALSAVDLILPPKSKRILASVLQGSTVQEIANQSGVPVKTVESQFGRLLRLIERNVLPK